MHYNAKIQYTSTDIKFSYPKENMKEKKYVFKEYTSKDVSNFCLYNMWSNFNFICKEYFDVSSGIYRF